MTIRPILVFCCLPLVACELVGPYDRTNPFDAGSPYVMTLSGVPDTAGAEGLRFTATIERNPPITLSPAIRWVTTDPNDLFGVSPLTHLFGGEYVVSNRVTAQLRTITVGARFSDEVSVGRNLVVGQLSATLALACGTVAAPAACDAAPVAPGHPRRSRYGARRATPGTPSCAPSPSRCSAPK
jgi:hypothetical protein